MVSSIKKKSYASSSSSNISVSVTNISVEASTSSHSLPSSPKKLGLFTKSPKKKKSAATNTTSTATDVSPVVNNNNAGDQQHIDISTADYLFSYEAVLDDEETRQCLLEYMRTIRCEESLLFLDQMNLFHRKRSTFNKWTMIQSIYDQFFCEHSKYELNLPQRVKDIMIHTYLDVVEEIAHRKRMNYDHNGSTTISTTTTTIVQPSPSTNNSEDVKDVSINSLDYVDLSDCEDSLKKAESYILINLKEYVFPKFVSSELFQEFISKKSKHFINSIGLVKALSHSCFVESLMDMKKCEINVDQVRMIKKHVFDAKHWDCIYEKDSTRGFLSSKKYILGEDTSKGVYFAKCEVIFPYSVHQIMNIMTNTKNRIEHDKNLESIKRIGYRNKSGATTNLIPATEQQQTIKFSGSSSTSTSGSTGGGGGADGDDDSDEDTSSSSSDDEHIYRPITSKQQVVPGKTKLATTLTHERYRLGWPIKSRYYLLAQSMVHDSTDNMYIIAKKSCAIPGYDPDEGNNIQAINIGCWMFQPTLDENQKECCKYIQFVGTDLRGSIPAFIIEKIVRKRTRYFYESTMKMIKACEADSNTRPQDSSGYFDTLDENGSIDM